MYATIALLTDFGLSDPYVGQMKAVLAGQAPGARVIDLSHDISPFNIVQAAFFLSGSVPYFPAGTVFLIVVDPGVGTSRRLVLAEYEGRAFIGPDNGVLGLVLPREGAVRAFDVTPASAPATATFHGRDAMAPLAARLVQGEPAAALGRPIRPQGLLRGDWASPKRTGRSVVTHVLHVDRFGNVILNLPISDWQEEVRAWAGPESALRLLHPREQRLRLARCYAGLPARTLGLVAGSQGHMELCENRGSAAQRLDLSSGDMIRLGASDAPGAADMAGPDPDPDDLCLEPKP